MNPMPKNIDLLQQLMQNMTDNIFIKNLDSKFIMINDTNVRWLGHQHAEDIIGKDDFDLFNEEFAQIARDDEKHLMKTGEPINRKEERIAWPDGRISWVTTTKVPLKDKEGNIVGLIGIGRDIDDLKQKELELEEANKKLRESYRKLSEASEQIQDDLRVAAQLQQTFLPQTYPQFFSDNWTPLLDFHHYYEADIQIGGDFCSIHKLSDTKAGLLICDVMGHGVRAALITSMVRTIADNLSQQTQSPGKFLTLMNQRLHPMLQTEDAYLFATACYLTIDTNTGVLEGAMAGHTVPFLIQPREEQVSLLDIAGENSGPALAVTPDHAYETFAVQLTPGDEVLMYTDGIFEAINADQDEFGVEQLQATIQRFNKLQLKKLLPNIVETVRDYCTPEKIGDDICLLGFTLHDIR